MSDTFTLVIPDSVVPIISLTYGIWACVKTFELSVSICEKLEKIKQLKLELRALKAPKAGDG